jgi:alpha-tubulin suppressor-like RCC1 family protein
MASIPGAAVRRISFVSRALLAGLALGSTGYATATLAGELAAGGGHTCATSSGPVYCWGWGQSGQLGDGGNLNVSGTPVAVPDSHGLIDLDAGGEHTCGRNAAGKVKCWGYDRWGQIGNGPAGSIGAVEAIGVSDAVQVAAGDQHSCALIEGGSIMCWGLSNHGQVGTGQFDYASDVPVAVTVVPDALSIAAGSHHTCAIVGLGQVQCWGRNHKGQLGSAPVADPGVATAVTVPGVEFAVALAAGAAHTCALLVGGSVTCWGDNTYGQLGATEVSDAVEISSGDQHVCVRHGNGSMSCWGYNGEGQLADGDAPNHSLTAVPVLGIDSADLISLGAVHSCARVSAEPVNFKCWGRGNFGQLGDGQYGGTHDVYAPVYVQGGEFDGVFGGSPGSFEGQ